MTLTLEPTPDADAASNRPRARRPSKHPEARLIGKRLLIYLVTFIGAVTVNFLIPRVMPGNPVQDTINRLQTQTGVPVPAATVKTLQNLLGGGPIVTGYFKYWWHLLHGDLGTSTSHYPVSVSSLIGTALPYTVGLVVISVVVAWFVGTALGAISGWNRGRRIDTVISLTAAVCLAVPSFWAALMIQYLLAYKFGWFPPSGGYDPSIIPGFSTGFVFSTLKYGLLPGVTLALVSFSGYSFTMRNMMVQTAADDYVLLARAKGLSSRRVLAAYAGRNAILPSVASLAQSLGGALGGAILIEVVFTYPGIGSLMQSGLANRDYPLIQGVFMVIMIAVLGLNFIADSIYVLIDPRTRDDTDA